MRGPRSRGGEGGRRARARNEREVRKLLGGEEQVEVLAGCEPGVEGGVDFGDEGVEVEAAGGDAEACGLSRNGCDAVIRSEGDHNVAEADLLVEPGEEAVE